MSFVYSIFFYFYNSFSSENKRNDYIGCHLNLADISTKEWFATKMCFPVGNYLHHHSSFVYNQIDVSITGKVMLTITPLDWFVAESI